jgi:hypothetical protein
MIGFAILVAFVFFWTMYQVASLSQEKMERYYLWLPVAESHRSGPSVFGVVLFAALLVVAFFVMEFFA